METCGVWKDGWKQERQVARSDLISSGQRLASLDADTIKKCAILAAEVADRPAVPFPLQNQVLPRKAGILGATEVIIAGPPD
jgi:hypothetical protein